MLSKIILQTEKMKLNRTMHQQMKTFLQLNTTYKVITVVEFTKTLHITLVTSNDR